jgi:hypothetical protein
MASFGGVGVSPGCTLSGALTSDKRKLLSVRRKEIDRMTKRNLKVNKGFLLTSYFRQLLLLHSVV